MNALHNSNEQAIQKQSIPSMNTTVDRHRASWFQRECFICGSKAIGINFGVPTCAPCKAFFRRNAGRKEILETSCHHVNENSVEEENIDNDETTVRYSQFRRCSSCRLRRCFDVGMKQELIRTDEENERHRNLVKINRKRREIINQYKVQDNQQLLPQVFNRFSHYKTLHITRLDETVVMNNGGLLTELDWQHLSNLVYSYDTNCLKTHLKYRGKISICGSSRKEVAMEQHSQLPINITLGLSLYFRSLPVFQSLTPTNQSFLYKHNLRRLILVNNHELNQACFSEPWQIAALNTSWEFVCGSEIYCDMSQVEASAERLWISDPIVTRLWLVILFFSTPLLCFYQPTSSARTVRKRMAIADIQNGYATLLWKYLLHRHGYMESARIYSNLIHVFLTMLRVALAIHIRFETYTEYIMAKNKFDQVTLLNTETLAINENEPE